MYRTKPTCLLGHLIYDAIIRLGIDYEEAAGRIRQAAHDDGEPYAVFSRKTLTRWLTGVVPQARTLRWIGKALGIPITDLAVAAETQGGGNVMRRDRAMIEFGPPSSGFDPTDLSNLTVWIESTNTSDAAIELLAVATRAAARDHTYQPPKEVLTTVLRTHRKVQAVLQSGRQRLRQTRELLRIDAQLLAHACLLLGDLHKDETALAFGGASVLTAAEAGSSPAEAFSAQAQLARWRNRYGDAADLAAAGYASSSANSLRVLLACQEANAAALVGDARRSRQALARAEAFQMDDEMDSAWACPPARHELYRLAVALHCGNPSNALHHAATARASWLAGQPASFGTAAHTRLAAAIACLKLGALDGASEHVGQVLTLPPQYRLATLVEHMGAVHALLSDTEYRNSSEAEKLAQQVAEFMSNAQVEIETEAE